ncbi:probable hydrolase PNKD [Halichondria panicea]|uniref:probable hydrolase PNKD n=1 Tax=Halichondria panicea TaxID=6063 RepID=UPI00312B6355
MFVLILLVCAVALLILRKTTAYWVKPVTKFLFPVGYWLYTTRLGYAFHLRSLNKEKSKVIPHSVAQPTPLSGVLVVPIPILSDNYSYFIIDLTSKDAVVVDPADPGAIKTYVVEKRINLKAILTTHKHWDHAGGNVLLKRQYPDLQVYGGANENVAAQTHPVKDNDTIKLGKFTIDVLSTPGHTTGHVVYVLQSEPPCVFTGDLIFVAGNGQMFEGTPQTMLASINRIQQLPSNSLLFPGHEYAFNDVKFASSLLPSYTPVQMKWQWVKQQRSIKLSTVPSILLEELKYNPFMLTDSDILKDALGLPHHTPPAEVLARLRQRKDNFRTN